MKLLINNSYVLLNLENNRIIKIGKLIEYDPEEFMESIKKKSEAKGLKYYPPLDLKEQEVMREISENKKLPKRSLLADYLVEHDDTLQKGDVFQLENHRGFISYKVLEKTPLKAKYII